MTDWLLQCSACEKEFSGTDLVDVCNDCGQPVFARYRGEAPRREDLLQRADMWRYSPAMPLLPGELPVSLGEGGTPLFDASHLADEIGVGRLWIKDEAVNPTASFKARGLSGAVTRGKALGVPGFTVPTAGNAGAALAAYAAAARIPARIFAPASTPSPILDTIRALGADLVTVDGHIGDAGAKARAFAAESGWLDVSTFREPYRTEGNRTLGLELAEQLGWRLPDAIIYPTGGGEGIIAMDKVFSEMRDWGWLSPDATSRLVVAQAAGCAPLVQAFDAGEAKAKPWPNPTTHAAGLRVPAPFADRLVLAALRESNGAAVAVDEQVIRDATYRLASATGIDAAPEGGAGLAALEELVRRGELGRDSEVVLFNTGSGASYRTPQSVSA
ncbi:MAG TPA: threonine synthase [Gemmatimonadales bacterium]|nr:threonine synthase [Gemmatimonadales bacterium]